MVVRRVYVDKDGHEEDVGGKTHLVKKGGEASFVPGFDLRRAEAKQHGRKPSVLNTCSCSPINETAHEEGKLQPSATDESLQQQSAIATRSPSRLPLTTCNMWRQFRIMAGQESWGLKSKCNLSCTCGTLTRKIFWIVTCSLQAANTASLQPHAQKLFMAGQTAISGNGDRVVCCASILKCHTRCYQPALKSVATQNSSFSCPKMRSAIHKLR